MSESVTAETLRNGSVGHADLGEKPEMGDAEHNGGGGRSGEGRRPPPPRPPRDRGYGGGRLPRWAELLLWGVLAALAFAAGLVVGQGLRGPPAPRKATEKAS